MAIDPLNRAVVVAWYVSRFEADVVAGRLSAEGIEAAVLGSDPAVAGLMNDEMTFRGFEVLVAASHQEAAEAMLADLAPGAAEDAPVGLGRRPRWFRWLAAALAASFVIPVAYGMVRMALNLC